MEKLQLRSKVKQNQELKIKIISGCIKAKPKAAPINGAVHGEATITDKAPVKKELTRPEFLLKFSSFPEFEKISMFVTKIKPIKNISKQSKVTTKGLCN